MTTKAYEIGQFGISLVVTDAGDISALSINTTQVSEGNNLYFTNARARGAISASGSLAYNSTTGALTYTQGNTDTIAEGTTNKYYTDTRVGTYLSTNSYATQTYVGTAISNLINSAPSTLDTLNELAAALGNDANYATTITTALGNKLSTSAFTTTANTWLGTKTADNLTEGSTNLYFTTTRARAAVSGGTIISYNSTTGVIGINDASIGVSKFDSTVANTFSTKGTSIAMAIALG